MLNVSVEKRILFLLSVLLICHWTYGQHNDQVRLANEYYQAGEILKAKDLYTELAKSPANYPDIHNNYFALLLSQQDFKEADKYLKRAIKSYPDNVYYLVDRAVLLEAIGDRDAVDKYISDLISQLKTNEYKTRVAAQHMINNRMNDRAIVIYKESRLISNDPAKYALELATAYRQLENKELMIEEYLKFAAARPGNLGYVKNILQNILDNDQDVEALQSYVLDRLQKEPDNMMYGDILIWINVQKKDFYGAFVQARALDKRFKEQGVRLLELGELAIQNLAYDDAIEIYSYIAKTYTGGKSYVMARQQRIKAQELKVKNVFPIQIDAIRQLTSEYDGLIGEIGINTSTYSAYRQKALLHAFYLHEYDTAISILEKIIAQPRLDKDLRARTKLDLGDIYLLIDQPWESTLLYSQVEKENKASIIGYEAKLRNAKLNYYVGNFPLAKSHLDILKEATSKEISNDAIALSLLIQDNTVMDSSDYMMKRYAQIELLIFQNKLLEAKQAFDAMLKPTTYHSLYDEIYWQLAQIEIRQGNFASALEHLEVICTKYSNDIWGDDALFLKAELYHKQLKDTNTAMEIYRQFLTQYPGSIFVSEARKRFRIIRGDQI